jgi:hypothetical protein
MKSWVENLVPPKTKTNKTKKMKGNHRKKDTVYRAASVRTAADTPLESIESEGQVPKALKGNNKTVVPGYNWVS